MPNAAEHVQAQAAGVLRESFIERRGRVHYIAPGGAHGEGGCNAARHPPHRAAARSTCTDR